MDVKGSTIQIDKNVAEQIKESEKFSFAKAFDSVIAVFTKDKLPLSTPPPQQSKSFSASSSPSKPSSSSVSSCTHIFNSSVGCAGCQDDDWKYCSTRSKPITRDPQPFKNCEALAEYKTFIGIFEKYPITKKLLGLLNEYCREMPELFCLIKYDASYGGVAPKAMTGSIGWGLDGQRRIYMVIRIIKSDGKSEFDNQNPETETFFLREVFRKDGVLEAVLYVRSDKIPYYIHENEVVDEARFVQLEKLLRGEEIEREENKQKIKVKLA